MIHQNDSEKAREPGLSRPVGVTRENECRERKTLQIPWKGGEKRHREDSCSRERDYQSGGSPWLTHSAVVSDTYHSGRLKKTTSCLQQRSITFWQAPKQMHRAAKYTSNFVLSNDNVLGGSQQDRTVFDQCIQFWYGFKQEREPSTVVQAIPG